MKLPVILILVGVGAGLVLRRSSTALNDVPNSDTQAQPARTVRAADPPRDSPRVTVYDPNPKHLWNRLHEALLVRLDGGKPDEPGQLDPFLWEQSPYGKKGERYRHAAAVLDEFLAKRGDKLIADPRKRALLQRDLWALFDTVAPSRFLIAPGKKDPEIELARRVAKILPRLALSAKQIKALPDNFAEAVKAGKFPRGLNAGRLWDADGPWVLLGSHKQMPVARSHVAFFGGRSAFFVFLRLPGGRKETLKYVAEFRSGGTPPKFPAGSRTALLRQMQLIDDRGRITLTPVVEAVQFRGAGNSKFQLSRKDFMGGKPSLRALGPDDRERAYLAFLGQNAGRGREKVLGTCFHCHQDAVSAMNSYNRPFPPAQSVRPRLLASKRGQEAFRAWVWKKERYEWGLLQGLLRSPKTE
jgi:hypothetical protein